MEYDQHVHASSDYNSVVETLANMFRDNISRDVLFTVVESCDGNVNDAANILMNMLNDNISINHNDSIDNTESSIGTLASEDTVHSSDPQSYPSPSTMSYSMAYRNTGAIPRRRPQVPVTTSKNHQGSEQINKILAHHNEGSKTLILMRGVPGSGKTYLGKKIIKMTVGDNVRDYQTHILSTDDYFTLRGFYSFDRSQLGFAHSWNQERAIVAIQSGLSPIVIDNTNIEEWEMEPYFKEGVKNGYYIEVVEPQTSWAKKVHILTKKNCHNVPASTIKKMLENFRCGLTAEDLFCYFRVQYPPFLKPPQIRNIPPFNKKDQNQTESVISSPENQTTVIFSPNNNVVETKNPIKNEYELNINVIEPNENKLKIDDFLLLTGENERDTKESTGNQDQEEALEDQMKYMKIQQQLEEMQKLELEWENGENWDDVENHEAKTDNQPQSSRNEIQSSNSDTPMKIDATLNCGDLISFTSESIETENDWSKMSMFLPPWYDKNDPSVSSKPMKPIIQTKSSETSMEIGDDNIQSPKPGYKVVIGRSRDINFHYFPPSLEIIPEVRMLDKSTSTKDETLPLTHRCKNEEKHFAAFRALFKTLPKTVLRDIFEQCCGDVNWAVHIVLDGVANEQFQFKDDGDFSDAEEVNQIDCDCVAAYDIIPDIYSEQETLLESDKKSSTSNISPCPIRRPKKEASVTESSLLLKRQIEGNVVIAENHYSPHHLKIRKMRRGDIDERGDLSEPIYKDSEIIKQEEEDLTKSFPPIHAAIPSTSTQTFDENAASITKNTGINICHEKSDDEDSATSEPEKTFKINLNQSLLSQLDVIFGRKDIAYPIHIEPKVNLPISIINEINALWMESLMCQLDEHDKKSDMMLKEDEEFARQLEAAEYELAKAGKEPEVPDFKEIMDMDLALSLYKKEIDEWRNNTPNDLAAKLTRDKLFNLFPDVSHDILTELLVAHDNNFQATVEVLLMSTGRTDILETENGFKKFVAQKELEIKTKLLEEERKVLAEVEWPILPSGGNVDMATVQQYRDEAERHLATRNLNYQRAQDYVRRGMTPVAVYFSTIAEFHRQKYERANSLAAAALMQVHASKSSDNATIDLHYLRVKEAREHLDLFLDTHIQKLRQNQNKGGLKYHTLFFITGRGLHSACRKPRVKPMVKKRLDERGIAYFERNPGLLCAKVYPGHELSYLIKSNPTVKA